MTTFKQFTDTQLVAIYQQTHAAGAFGELYVRYHEKVFLYCTKILKNSHMALDLTQDIFLKITKKILKLKSAETFVKWLFTIAKNHCMDSLRKKKRMAFHLIDNAVDVPADQVDVESVLAKEQQLTALEFAMKHLTQEEINLLKDRYFNKTSVLDLATKYQLSESAVKMRLLRTRKKLEQYLAPVAA